MMHYLVVTVCRVLGTTVVQVVFALEHHSLAFRAKSATTTRVALSPVTALFRMVELRSVLPMAPYVQDISASNVTAITNISGPTTTISNAVTTT